MAEGGVGRVLRGNDVTDFGAGRVIGVPLVARIPLLYPLYPSQSCPSSYGWASVDVAVDILTLRYCPSKFGSTEPSRGRS